MAIKVSGTTVIDNSKNLTNVASIGFADGSSLTSSTLSPAAYLTTDNVGGQLLHTLDNPNAYGTSATDYFGRAAAISGNYAIVGASSEDDSGSSGSGKAYIFNVTTGALIHTLDNPNAYDTSASDYFGFPVAISGNYAIVAAYQEDDAGGTGSGKAYIFNVTTGALVHTLDNPNAYDTSANDYFGREVAIDGNYCIVGASSEDDSGGTGSGKAYIFNVTTGALLHTLDNPNPYDTSLNDTFGLAAAISGNYCIVGAASEDDSGGSNSGKAYIYNVTTGALVHTLDNPNAYSTSQNDYFGNKVAISGNYAIVGAYFEDDGGKAYIFNVTTGALLHTLDNPNAYGFNNDYFGENLAISGNYAVFGVLNEDDSSGTDSGKAYIFNVTTGALIHTLDNPNAYNTSISDWFGGSVGISGNYVIVGAYQEDDAGGTGSGKAYIFNVDNSLSISQINSIKFTHGNALEASHPIFDQAYVGGQLIYTLDNPNPYGTSTNDYFGSRIAISGNYAIVSANIEDDAGGSDSGKAYIFNVTTGALVHTLDNPNAYSTSASDYFGISVAISGNYAIVGAYGEDDSSGTTSGKAYIYKTTDGTWTDTTLVHTLDNPNPYGTSDNDRFGLKVDISGNYAIVSADLEDDSGGTQSGKAYIFNVTTGALVHTLDNPNAYDTSTNDYFGTSVAIDGNYAIVGVLFEDDSGGGNSGKAYIFNVTTGALVHTLDNPNAYDTSTDDNFGTSVAIDGNYAIVGAIGEDDSGGTLSGKAYIFNVTTGALVHTLDNPNAYDTSTDDNFGVGVAISGNYAIVSAYTEDESGGTSSGKAYIYKTTDGTWTDTTLVHTLDNPNAYGTSTNDRFGNQVAISGNYAIVSAYQEDDSGGTESGKAYVFAADNMTYLDKAAQLVLE